MGKGLDKAQLELDALRASLEAFIAAGPQPKAPQPKPYKDGRAYVHIVLPTAQRKPAKRTASAQDTATASALDATAQLAEATASAIAAAERLEVAAERLEALTQATAQAEPTAQAQPKPEPQSEPAPKPRGFRANYRAAYRAERERLAKR